MNSIKKYVKEYWILLFLTFTSLMYTYMDKFVKIGINTRVLSSVLLIPLLVVFLLYLYQLYKTNDKKLKDFCKSNFIDILIISFAVFYGALTVYRMISGLEFLESMHYAARFFGSVALYFFIKRQSLNKETLLKNIVIIAFIIDLLVILDYIVNKSFRETKIFVNVIVLCCFILLTVPVCLKYLLLKSNNKFLNFSCYVHIVIMITGAFLTGSRLMMFLGLFVFAVCIIFTIKEKKILIKSLISTGVAILLISSLYLIDVGDARLCVDKQIYTLSGGLVKIENENKPNKENHNYTAAENMMIASDSMRTDLIKLGLEEVNKNLLFGTGDILYDYDMNGVIVSQSPHNFILESLIIFGLIGSLLLLTIVLGIFKTIFFVSKGKIFEKSLVLVVGIVFLAFGMLQPVVFNAVIMPTVFCVLASFDKCINE